MKSKKEFDAKCVKESIVKWIRDWFNENGEGCNAVVGISGGKDSTVVAGLCVEALGKDRVIGVMMPCGGQSDIRDSYEVVDSLGIKRIMVNILGCFNAIMQEIDGAAEQLKDYKLEISNQAYVNLQPRLRMSTLYAISQSCNGRVANTCNLSEDYIGYSTRYGDTAGDFSPLASLTSDEVVAIGDELNIPGYLVHKTPSDGLCGKTDEDNFGFTYAVLNEYIRTGKCKDEDVKNKIDYLHKKNAFKLLPMPHFKYLE